jgi:adenylosuccinate lyase
MLNTNSRRGTVLILVLGLITLFMALILSATVRVFNASKTMATLQKNVQAHLMMRSATILIARAGAVYATPITIGDTFTSASFPAHSQAHRMGWAHLKGDYVIAVGGSTGGAPGKGASIATATGSPSEQELSNAMEVRYYYTVTDAAPDDNPGPGVGPYVVTLKTVGDNSAYPW